MNEWHRSFLVVLNCSLNHSCIALDDDDDNGSTTLCVRVKRDDNGTAGFGDTIHTVADNCPWNVEVFAGGGKINLKVAKDDKAAQDGGHTCA